MTGIANTSQLRVLHTADLHLDRPFASWGNTASTRRQDQLATLDTIGDLARRNQVDLVLLAGDQFDRHNPGASIVSRFHGWLDRLNQAGIQVALISGNHDSYWYEDSVYRGEFPANTLIFREPACEAPMQMTVNGHTVWLYGIAHDHTRQREVLPGFKRRSDDGVHIGLMHATVDAPADFAVQDRYLPLRSSDLQETGLDYIGLGHIHRARTINAGARGMAAYPGSPEPLDVSETGPRGVAMLTFRGGPPELETLSCGCRTAHRETLDCTNLTESQIVERIAGYADDSLILSVTLTGAPWEFPEPESLWQRLSGQFCHLSIRDETSVVDSGFVRDIEAEHTIRGQFVRQLRERIASAESERERQAAELALRVGLIRLEQRSAR